MALRTPYASSAGVYAWTNPEIYAARAMQMSGSFAQAAEMADAMRTDDALFNAYENRLAPIRCLTPEVKPAAASARALSIANEADALYGANGIGLSVATVCSIIGCLVNHGVAFSVTDWRPREDGSRVDMFVRYWPIEFVRWDATRGCFMARVDSTSDAPTTDENGVPTFGEVPIVHGDGRWTIYAKHEHKPWRHGALIAACLVWSRHAFAMRDWAKGSVAHGNAKVTGEMPQGMALQSATGALTPEAAAFLELLQAMATEEAPAGIIPAGAKVTYLANTSTAWQVWSELGGNGEKAAARIYLGTDGTLGAQGGAPGVDITALFGVAATLVQGDVGTFATRFGEGVLDVWTAVNFGDSSMSPSREYMLPDADEAAEREERAKRREAFFADIERAKDLGFVVDQAYVDAVAKIHGIDPPTLPPPQTATAPTIALAPTDLANVVFVNEARASAGLGPLMRAGVEDPDGYLTIAEFKAKKEAASAASASPPAAA